MSSSLRFKMVDAAINHTAIDVHAPEGRPSDYFGAKVFTGKAMRKYLDKKTFEALTDTMANGTPLTREVADSIAAGMRQWALEHGADHYTHRLSSTRKYSCSQPRLVCTRCTFLSK